MFTQRLPNLLLALLIAAQAAPLTAQTQPIAKSVTPSDTRASDKPQPQPPAAQEENKNATDAAANMRQNLPVLPSVTRGRDGLLNTNGQRATQNLLVTSSNVKDPVTDTFIFAGALPLEAAEAVQIPSEQFTVSLPKFYATVPVLDQISKGKWHFSAVNPLFAVKRDSGSWKGLRSATPTVSATGPLFGGRLDLFQSFGYRLSKSTVESLENGHLDSTLRSYDWNTHADFKPWRGHTLSARLALFSQGIDAATLNALMEFKTTPNFLTRGGQMFLSDSYGTARGAILDSSISVKKVRVRILPRGNEPMEFEEQGELYGNYFDTVRRSSSRIEWKETLRLPERTAWGRHQLSFGGGLARAAFHSARFGNTIVFICEEEGEEEGERNGEEGEEEAVVSTTTFTGSPFESLSASELTGWAEDRWAPSRRVSLTLGLRYDWGTISRKNQWAPRLGFAVLPFSGGHTVIRGGAGLFYDVMPLTVGTFTRSRQRVIQFFHEGKPVLEPNVLGNLLARPRLTTPHVLGWNLEVDRQVTSRLLVRVKAEERRGLNQLLIALDPSTPSGAALVLSDSGTSRYRELEATASFKPARWSNLNVSYIRSAGAGDLNVFVASTGTFEKLFISPNRYGRSRSDSPNRWLAWGDVRGPLGVLITPALDVHTGFPFAFVDASGTVPSETDFGRFPRTVTLDIGLFRDVSFKTLDRHATLRLGLKVFNVTNHFNPNDAYLGEAEAEAGRVPVLKGFLDGSGRSYRVSAVFNF